MNQILEYCKSLMHEQFFTLLSMTLAYGIALLRIKVEYLAILALNLILTTLFFSAHDIHYMYLYFEIIVFLSWFYLTRKQGKLIIIGSQYISLICIGSMVIMVYFFSMNFVLNVINLQQSALTDIRYIEKAVILVATMFCIGLPPFTKLIITGYTKLKLFMQFHVITIPLMLAIYIVQSYSYDIRFKTILGVVISIYSTLNLLIEKDARKIKIYLIIYCFGNMIALNMQKGAIFHYLLYWILINVSFLINDNALKTAVEKINNHILRNIIVIMYVISILSLCVADNAININTLFNNSFHDIHTLDLLFLIKYVLFTMFLGTVVVKQLLIYYYKPPNSEYKKLLYAGYSHINISYLSIAIKITTLIATTILLVSAIRNNITYTQFAHNNKTNDLFLLHNNLLFIFITIIPFSWVIFYIDKFFTNNRYGRKIFIFDDIFLITINATIKIVKIFVKYINILLLEVRIQINRSMSRFIIKIKQKQHSTIFSYQSLSIILLYIQIIILITIECFIKK